MASKILIGLAFTVLALVIGSAHGREPASPSSTHFHYDPRNFDGVWHLAEGGKFGPVA